MTRRLRILAKRSLPTSSTARTQENGLRYLNGIFQSFLQAGFECSTHRNRHGKRLDLLASTRHDTFARLDYERLNAIGISTIRLAARWYLIEETPRKYDFSSLRSLSETARDAGMEVVLDILHFGFPDHIDVFSDDFPERFADFTQAIIPYLKDFGIRLVAPVNEVSYVAWAGGDKGCISPFATGRGHEMKHNLIRAAVRSSEVLLNDLPGVRLIAPEPVINIVGDPAVSDDEREAAEYTTAMYEAWDMLSGRLHPELGGKPEFLDIIGINFYERNQWIHNHPPITRNHPRWVPFHDILFRVWERYQRPMFVAETGTEDEGRASWFHYVCDEVRAALRVGVPIHGICLYPILNHLGWDDDRRCANGLWDHADEGGHREIHTPLADAVRKEDKEFRQFLRLPMTTPPDLDLICFSHLRWGFVFQRPQHLMSRFARERRVFFLEEPIFEDGPSHLRITTCAQSGVQVCTPVLPKGLSSHEIVEQQQSLLDSLVAHNDVADFIGWYYTPMAREFSRHLDAKVIVYDCMDELSAFAGAPPAMRANEQELLRHADLVFTGGHTLFESKRNQHPAVHAFPSSVDVTHFAKAKNTKTEPDDQSEIPQPRIGYAGVIDERMDLELLRSIAQLRSDWHFVLIGPTCKIDPAHLPQAANIHYLGMKSYADLPAYFSGWQIGMLPFALNESTRFISPTKTPEYLAAGLRVVSTPIRDVVRPYGELGLAAIADTPQKFVECAAELLQFQADEDFIVRAGEFLSRSSWDKTWCQMNALIGATVYKQQDLDRFSDTQPDVEGVAHV